MLQTPLLLVPLENTGTVYGTRFPKMNLQTQDDFVNYFALNIFRRQSVGIFGHQRRICCWRICTTHGMTTLQGLRPTFQLDIVAHWSKTF